MSEKWSEVRLDKKVQLEILDEVYEKGLHGKPIEIDRSKRDRAHNFNWLRDKKNCFVFATCVKQVTVHFPNGTSSENSGIPSEMFLAGLSKEGREYREELVPEVKEEQRKDEELILSRKRMQFAGIALIVSIISLVVSFIALFR